jgi:hypothetical protein
MTRCPKCKAVSGDSWAQCKGSCPMPGSPHYKPEGFNEAQQRAGFSEQSAQAQSEFFAALGVTEIRVGSRRYKVKGKQ